MEIPPQAMDRDRSFSQHLQSLNEEDGLIAEIEFRKHHFDSMAAWPANDERVKVFRYEDILGNEIETFRDMFEFYGMSWPTRTLGLALAKRFSAQGKSQLKSHIRNPKSGQWKERFSPRVVEYFELRHPGVIARYGYEPSECLC